ncbi:unnamed protein product [Prunus armeniaca]
MDSACIVEKTLSTFKAQPAMKKSLQSGTTTLTTPLVLSALHAPSTLALSKPCGGHCQRGGAIDLVLVVFFSELSWAF